MAISPTTFINGMKGTLAEEPEKVEEEPQVEETRRVPKAWAEDNVYTSLRRLDMKLAHIKFYGKRR